MATRESREDFEALTEFAKQYSIESCASNDDYIANLKLAHKRLFGLLTFVTEIEQLNDDSGKYSRESLAYFAECSSDVAQVVFSWMHGSYKPSYLSLRSAIETFLKAAVGTENPAMFTEKSMYELLDLAKVSDACGGLAAPHFLKLKGKYAELCKVAHSATAAKVTQVNALRMFPKFEEEDARALIEIMVDVVDCILAIILADNRDLLAEMHYRNRANILDTLTKDIKRSILGEVFE